MPNPISSAVQEMVTNSLTSKFLGGNKKSEDVHQQQNKSSSSSSPFGGSAGLLGKISSTIASAVSSTNQQQVPDQQQQQMSGGHYNQSYYAGASYPQQQQQQQGTPGYPPSAGGYPQQQHQQGNPGYPPSPSAGGYPPQPQQQQPQYGPGGTPPYGTLGAYPPQQQQQAPYPTAGNIGFNVNAIPTTGGGYPPYQPNLGGFSGGPSPAPYPQQQQHHHHQQYQQAPYPASSGGYPQMQQQQQHHTQNYPQMQQHHHTPQMQQQHHHHTPQMQQQQTHSRTRSGGSPTHSRTRSGGSSTHSGGSSTHSRTRKTSGGSPTHSRTRKTSGGSPTHSRTRKTSGGSPTMATPSIRPNPNFNAQVTAELLRKAMKGLGCDKGKVIQALVNCSNSQRQEVIRTFKQMYGKDLIHDLRSELSGDFEDLILALMEHPAVCDAAQLRRAMQGIGTKEHVLIEIMTTRTNAQIHAIKMAYRQMFHADLEHDIVGDTSGYFRRLLVSLCSGSRDENMHTDPVRANQDAQRLWRAGEARLGTDEIAFNSVLAAQNFAQLRLVFEEYQRQHGHSIEQAIANEFSGDIRDANLALVKSIRSRSAYFAELLYKSMKGLGTRDTDLIRVVVTRSEIDLGDIRQAYQKMYGTPLEKAIAGDCSGAYKDGLIAIVKGH